MSSEKLVEVNGISEVDLKYVFVNGLPEDILFDILSYAHVKTKLINHVTLILRSDKDKHYALVIASEYLKQFPTYLLNSIKNYKLIKQDNKLIITPIEKKKKKKSKKDKENKTIIDEAAYKEFQN